MLYFVILLLIPVVSYAQVTKYEAENQVLGGRYIIEQNVDASNGAIVRNDGSITVSINLETGIYDITTRYISENDGSDHYKLSINNILVDEWNSEHLSDVSSRYDDRVTRGIEITKPSTIVLSSVRGLNSKARVDYIELTGSDIEIIPYQGSVEIHWNQNYVDILGEPTDVLSYKVYVNGDLFKEVQDDDSGEFNINIKFPDDYALNNDSNFCVQIESYNGEYYSGKTEQVCERLVNYKETALPVKPENVSILIQ